MMYYLPPHLVSNATVPRILNYYIIMYCYAVCVKNTVLLACNGYLGMPSRARAGALVT
jgi:hypothetical protein